MIRSMRRCTRHPSGVKLQTPAATWRTNPPRTSSLCETASASAGSSRSVGKNSFDARAIMRCPSRLFEGNKACFGHRERGRLGHLQALRALHPALDPEIDLVEELVDQDVGGDLLQHPAVGVDEADVAA